MVVGKGFALESVLETHGVMRLNVIPPGGEADQRDLSTFAIPSGALLLGAR